MPRARLILDLLPPGRTHRYGPRRSQRADLHLPRAPGPHPVAVLIHGGSWRAKYGKIVMRGLAEDLRRRGWAAWNIEYRRIGRGQRGGWPATFQDVATAIDALATVSAPLDLDRVVVIGHSAGGQLALWTGARSKLADGSPGARPRVSVRAVVSLAGVSDLAGTHRAERGGVVDELLGGSPESVPERFAVADPLAHVPLEIPVLLVHGTSDETVPVRRSRDYARAARLAGAPVELVELTGAAGAHRAHIWPDGEAWAVVVAWLEAVLDRYPGRAPVA